MGEKPIRTIINFIIEVYSREQREWHERLCPPNLDALNDVKASADFLTDLDENDDIGGAWDWMV